MSYFYKNKQIMDIRGLSKKKNRLSISKIDSRFNFDS